MRLSLTFAAIAALIAVTPAAAQTGGGGAWVSTQKLEQCVRTQMREKKWSEQEARSSCACVYGVYEAQMSAAQKARIDEIDGKGRQVSKDEMAEFVAIFAPANRAANRTCFNGQRVLPE